MKGKKFLVKTSLKFYRKNIRMFFVNVFPNSKMLRSQAHCVNNAWTSSLVFCHQVTSPRSTSSAERKDPSRSQFPTFRWIPFRLSWYSQAHPTTIINNSKWKTNVPTWKKPEVIYCNSNWRMPVNNEIGTVPLIDSFGKKILSVYWYLCWHQYACLVNHNGY